MSLDAINGFTVIPHLPADKVTYSRAWATTVATGTNGSEDRAAARTAPLRQIEYAIKSKSLEENVVLRSRIKAALQSGKAVVPIFRRRAECTHGIPGQLVCVSNRWDWAVGDWVYAAERAHDGLNSYHHFDVGGAGTGEWQPEANATPATGETATTEAAIATIDGLACPPLAVRQTCRYIDGREGGPIQGLLFTIPGLPVKRLRVRVWFAFFADAPDDPSGDVGVYLNNVPSAVGDPWVACGSAKNALGYIDADGHPDPQGNLAIAVYARTTSWIQVNAISVYATSWQVLEVQSITYADLFGHHVLTRLQVDPKQVTLPGFDGIKEVFPMLFGKPTSDQFDGITDWYASYRIKVEENNAVSITRRADACPVEVCGITPPTIPPEIPDPVEGTWEEGKEYVVAHAMATFTTSSGVKTFDPYTLTWGDPMVMIPPKETFVELFKAVLIKCQQDYVAENGPASFGAPIWVRQSSNITVLAGAFADFDGALTRQWYTRQTELPVGEIPPGVTYSTNGYWTLMAEIIN